MLWSAPGRAQTSIPQRPHILGIAHVALNVGNPQETLAFYRDFLGFAQPFSLKRPDGTPWISYVKINDQQYLELFLGTRGARGKFNHFALSTDDIAGMANYLAAWRIHLEEPIRTTRTGDALLSIRDPAGNLIEIVQYQSGSWTDGGRGQFLPPTRISDHLSSIGLVIRNPVPVVRFYRDILGFRPLSRPLSGKQTHGFALQVPDGPDDIEFEISNGQARNHKPPPEDYLALHCFDLQKSAAILRSRRGGRGWNASIAEGIHDRLLLSDPDGNELQIRSSPIFRSASAK